MLPTHIVKRDGRIEPFQATKITKALQKALTATGTEDGSLAETLAQKVVDKVEKQFIERYPTVEEVQDLVEETLIESGLAEVARAYIRYRSHRAEVRRVKKLLGVSDELKLSVNAIAVLQRRYLLRDDEGNIIETPAGMFQRVAQAIAEADALYGAKEGEIQRTAEEFYHMMARLEFLPNSPTLMNAGTPLGQLSACFVLPVEDSIESIFTTLKHMALIQRTAGGTGFSFSRLRPKGDLVRSTKGISSGPVSFMKIYDTTTDVLKAGGKRRGANMGILRCDHPDILEFITAKEKPGVLENFNLSVAVTDTFMEAVEQGKDYPLINPRTGQEVRRIKAKDVFDLIVNSAWRTGDPGLIFIDEINRKNPTAHLGPIESTNPCGEIPLHPYESCNLGSINLFRMFNKEGQFDWDYLRATVQKAVHFLDNVIDVNRYVVPETEKATKANRRIGLGVMGFADALIKLGIPYDTEEAIRFAEQVMSFITAEARKYSLLLGQQRGSFPNFKGSLWEKEFPAMRNATVTTVAPTGTISIIANCSSGIEPIFAVVFIREVMEGARLLEVNPVFEEIARKRGFYSQELMTEVARRGSVRGLPEVPEEIQRVFVTAMEVAPEWHVRMQSAFQKYVDNAVSKTVNLPKEATPEEVRKVFWMAYQLKCKGITVYRYGSKTEQVLYIGPQESRETLEPEHVRAASEYAGGCPAGECPL